MAQHDAALRGLVSDGTLSEAQYRAVLAALIGEKPRPPVGRVLAEVAAYVGAGLVLGGIGLLLDASWEQWTRLVRAGILLVVAVIAGLAGVWFAGGPGELFRVQAAHTSAKRVAAVLFGVAALASAGVVDNLVGGEPDRMAEMRTEWVGFAVAVMGYFAVRSLVGVALSAVFGAVAVPSTLYVLGIHHAGCWGLLALGGVWLAAARLGIVTERWAGYLVGIVLACAGAQDIDLSVDGNKLVSHVVTLLVAVVCFGIYLGDRRWVLLLGGSLATASAVGAMVWDWSNAAGAAIAVLLGGAVVLGVGGVSLLRIRSGAADEPADQLPP